MDWLDRMFFIAMSLVFGWGVNMILNKLDAILAAVGK